MCFRRKHLKWKRNAQVDTFVYLSTYIVEIRSTSYLAVYILVSLLLFVWRFFLFVWYDEEMFFLESTFFFLFFFAITWVIAGPTLQRRQRQIEGKALVVVVIMALVVVVGVVWRLRRENCERRRWPCLLVCGSATIGFLLLFFQLKT